MPCSLDRPRRQPRLHGRVAGHPDMGEEERFLRHSAVDPDGQAEGRQVSRQWKIRTPSAALQRSQLRASQRAETSPSVNRLPFSKTMLSVCTSSTMRPACTIVPPPGKRKVGKKTPVVTIVDGAPPSGSKSTSNWLYRSRLESVLPLALSVKVLEKCRITLTKFPSSLRNAVTRTEVVPLSAMWKAHMSSIVSSTGKVASSCSTVSA